MDWEFLLVVIFSILIFLYVASGRHPPKSVSSECHIRLEIKEPLSARTRHIVSYRITNKGKKPIRSHDTYISGFSPVSIGELGIKAYDVNGEPLNVKIIGDKPLRKDIVVEFNREVPPGGETYYTLEYYWDRSDTYDIHVQSFMRKLTFSLVYPSEVELKEAKAYRIIRTFMRTIKHELGEPLVRKISRHQKEAAWSVANIYPNTTIQFMWSFSY